MSRYGTEAPRTIRQVVVQRVRALTSVDHLRAEGEEVDLGERVERVDPPHQIRTPGALTECLERYSR